MKKLINDPANVVAEALLGIEAAHPLTRVLRGGVVQIVLAKIEDELETPVSRQGNGRVLGQIRKIRSSIAIENVFQVPLRRTIAAVALVPRMRSRPRSRRPLPSPAPAPAHP